MTKLNEIENTTDAMVIAEMVGAYRRRNSFDDLRQFVDEQSGGQLETYRLDALTNMVAERIPLIWARPTFPRRLRPALVSAAQATGD